MVRLLLLFPVIRFIRNTVSIPQWYDYYQVRRLVRRGLKKVSIPQWYDYYHQCNAAETYVLKFQFLNGTIITVTLLKVLIEVGAFQFLNGTIITHRTQEDQGTSISFQFLNGTIITLPQILSPIGKTVSIPQWYDYYLLR